MSGSVSLAGEAAIRTGAGLVTVAVPQGIQAEVAGHRAEYMTLPLPQTGDGTLAEAAGGWVAHIMEGKKVALVLGPGMRILETGPGIITRLLESSWPLVLDADALNTMAQNPKDYQPLITERGGAVVMTPHPGELARLMGVPAELIQSDRLAWARRAAAEWGAVVALKGAGTVVASPDGEACLNINGGPWLATGGTGDILAGMIAALLAQGVAPIQAAAAGVYLHGAAGDLTVKEEKNEIMAAGDLLGRIGRVWTALARGDRSEKDI
jgi:NAD(P)H-hydrate epimerase